jgi:formamidopyrimidine-DNA glycosylase
VFVDDAPSAGGGEGQHDAVGTMQDPYLCVLFGLSDGRILAYRDVRRLGTMTLMRPDEWAAYEADLGPEPLDESFTPAAVSALLRDSRQAVKAVLMDQRKLAGIGNIYATEGLWRAGIDPSREAGRVARDAAAVSRLYAALREVLAESIAARGTTFRDYRDAYGDIGGYARALQAYGRAGQPCVRCGRRLVGTHAIDGRMTVFCPGCQA